jgi:hypothetical protein
VDVRPAAQGQPEGAAGLAATAAIFAIIHVAGMLGYQTGGNTLRGYGP